MGAGWFFVVLAVVWFLCEVRAFRLRKLMELARRSERLVSRLHNGKG